MLVLVLVLVLVLQVRLMLPEAAPWFVGAFVAGNLFHSLTYCDVLRLRPATAGSN